MVYAPSGSETANSGSVVTYWSGVVSAPPDTYHR